MKRFPVNATAVFGILLAVGFCFWLDTRLSFRLPAVSGWISWGIVLTGIILLALAETAFLAWGGATGAPADPTKRLVVFGIYRWVRNPIYLGGALVLLGVALARRSPTLLSAAALFSISIHFTVVRSEERRLEADFGQDYLENKRRVPRWIPRVPRKK